MKVNIFTKNISAIAILILIIFVGGCLDTDFGRTFSSDRDGDGIKNDEDAFPDNPLEWLDSDGDNWGDNSDPYPFDYDNDGFADAIDIDKYGDMALKITLEKFAVVDELDYLLRDIEVFFHIYINNRLEFQVDNNGFPWYVDVDTITLIESELVYNIDDDQRYTHILIQMWDNDWPLESDIIDIDGHNESKGLSVVFDALTGTWSGDDSSGYADGRADGVDEGQLFFDDDDGILWYNLQISDVNYFKTYTWNYNFKSYSFNVDIPIERYSYYKTLDVDRSPSSASEMASFVTADDVIVMEIANQLTTTAQRYTYDYYEIADFSLRFVQNLKYTYDNYTTPTNEYWRFPVETLVDETGDCEDTSVLYASIMEAMGYDAVLILIPGHAAVGIAGDGYSGSYYTYDDIDYYYCETTGTGWNLGDIPEEYEEESATVIQV